MAARVIEDFRSGKKTRRGGPLPPEEMPPAETVTAVPRREALAEFGCRNERELRLHLRRLRALGVLIADDGKLTKRVRVGTDARGYPRKARFYVVRGTDVPRYRKWRGPRVATW